MGKAFFTSWLLWEKMVFVLACSIVLTIIAGLFKLWYDHYRIRQFSALPPQKAELNREKSIIRSLSRRNKKTEMSEKRPRVIDDGVEIPFGIRAIESGIEVDGVWISRTNTPVRVPSSLRSLSNTDLEAGMQSTSSRPSSRPVSRVVLPRTASQDSTLSEPSSGDMMTQSGGLRYPPHSYSRYENTRVFRKSRAMNSSDNVSRPASTYGNASNRSSSVESTRRNGSTSSNEGGGPYEVPAVRPRQVNYAALDMLQAHRTSQAAETGQLIPRSRKPGQSGEWASMANYPPIVSGEIVNFSLPRNSSDLSTPPGSSSSNRSNPFTTPSSEKPSMSFGEPQSASSEGSYEALPRVRRSSSSFSAGRPDSDVLREVNPGFSVLRPGTLDSQRQAQSERNRSISPTQGGGSRSASIDSETRQKRRSRRLQKRRPSDDSGSERMSMDSDQQAPSSVFSGYSGSELARPPSAIEIARGAEIERNSVVKFSFDAGQRPPSAVEMTKGAEVEAGAKYKF